MLQNAKRAIGAETMIVMATQNQKGSEPVPIDPALLDWAEYWYPIAWKGLLAGGVITAIGACAGIAFLLLQWRTSTIREEQSEWRTSALELQTAQAKRDTANALERAALANQRAAEINAKYGARELRLEQVEFLANRLRGAPLKVVIREEPSIEAHMYGYHFLEVFKRAGIETSREYAEAAPTYTTGLHVVDPAGTWQTRQFTPGMTALVGALRDAGIEFSADWFWQTIPRAALSPTRPAPAPGPPPPVPDGFVLMYIGPKPIPRPDPTAPVIPR
jgi:hypothetical protein